MLFSENFTYPEIQICYSEKMKLKMLNHELLKHHVIKSVVDGELTVKQAAELSTSNFTHFREILSNFCNIDLPYSTLYPLLTANNIKISKKRRKKKKQHSTRERKASEELMLHADATPFPWFGNNISYTMHGFIDDATGKITGLYICKNKCLPGYLEILKQTLTSFEKPLSFLRLFFILPSYNYNSDENYGNMGKIDS